MKSSGFEMAYLRTSSQDDTYGYLLLVASAQERVQYTAIPMGIVEMGRNVLDDLIIVF